MISDKEINALHDQALVGRGLWIGVRYHRQEAGTTHPIDDYLPDDAHVTVLHLGKRVSRTAVAGAVDAAISASQVPGMWPCTLEITGVGWFWRKETPTLVALVNSRALGDLRGHVREICREVVRDYYGFIPHVTLRPEPAGEEQFSGPRHLAQLMSQASPLRWQVTSLQIHCGDVTVNVENQSPW